MCVMLKEFPASLPTEELGRQDQENRIYPYDVRKLMHILQQPPRYARV